MNTKAELRLKYKKLRANLSVETIETYSLDIANQLLSLDIWNQSYYHVFLPIATQKEVNTEYLLHILQGKDKNCIISKSDFKSFKMTHFLLQDNTKLKVNSYGIPEPVDGIEIQEHKIDVVFVPLLAFDKQGNRIGYGKGFYDRFLANCKPNCIKIGLSFFESEPKISDVLESDIKLNYCVTPNRTYSF